MIKHVQNTVFRQMLLKHETHLTFYAPQLLSLRWTIFAELRIMALLWLNLSVVQECVWTVRATLKEPTVRSVKPASIVALKVSLQKPAHPVPAPTPPLQVPATAVSWRRGFRHLALCQRSVVSTVLIFTMENQLLCIYYLSSMPVICVRPGKKFPSLPHLLVTPLSQLYHDTVNSIFYNLVTWKSQMCQDEGRADVSWLKTSRALL